MNTFKSQFEKYERKLNAMLFTTTLPDVYVDDVIRFNNSTQTYKSTLIKRTFCSLLIVQKKYTYKQTEWKVFLRNNGTHKFLEWQQWTPSDTIKDFLNS